MGLALDPNQTVDFVLATDVDKPEQERPTFVFRYVTSREFNAMGRLFQDADKEAQDNQRYTSLVYKAVAIPLVGWRNVKDFKGNAVPFNPDDLDAVTSISDMHDLRFGLLSKIIDTEADRKNSVRLAQSTTVNSAETVKPVKDTPETKGS